MVLLDTPGHLIRRLHQVSTQLFQRRIKEAGYDLTQVQYAAMEALRSNPKIDQAQISALIAYDRATIGGVVDRLAKKGYVKRVVSSHDRRAREVSLTEHGMHVLQSLHPIVHGLQREILQHLDDAERERFLTLAKKAIIKVS